MNYITGGVTDCINITKTRPCFIQRIFSASKIEKNHYKKLVNFNMFAQNIDCRYTLEPPRLGGSNEYRQSMFWKKNMYTAANPSFLYKIGV